MFSSAEALMNTADRARKDGTTEALSRLRVKVAQMDRSRVGGCALTISQLAVLDDVLALIDEEMRDA